MRMLDHTVLVAAKVCPKAPPGAQAPVDELTGYVLWGVKIVFGIAVLTALGAVVGGRMFSMPHASKIGIISLVVVFAAAIGYLTLPGLLDTFMGKGCV